MKLKTVLAILFNLILITLLSFADNYQDEVQKFRKSNPKQFIIKEYEPFVITGDIQERWLNQIVNSTIKKCAQALYQNFFQKKPNYLIKIYLFKNKTTYRYYSKKLFDIKPDTPFGYYLSSSHSLIMNIATGSGTLVHELVHALIEVDFPRIPTWFNEGMGSLFEACTCGEHIYGILNWRLPILQKGLKHGKFVPLKELFSSSRDKFYQDDKNMNYGEARYFCLYMQKMKLLRSFYRLFRDHVTQDPSGLTFVEKVFNAKIAVIEKKWLKWLRTLRY